MIACRGLIWVSALGYFPKGQHCPATRQIARRVVDVLGTEYDHDVT